VVTGGRKGESREEKNFQLTPLSSGDQFERESHALHLSRPRARRKWERVRAALCKEREEGQGGKKPPEGKVIVSRAAAAFGTLEPIKRKPQLEREKK